MKKYLLHGKLSASSGHANALANILVKASELMAKEKGCEVYAVSEDGNDIWVTEIWQGKADHDKSLENPEVMALIAQAIPLLEGKPEKGQELMVLGGHGI